jgi:protoheme IX farnesyltransferase
MKLRVVELLLVSTLPAMILAVKGLPSFSLVAATIFAGTLAAGSANAFNMVIESDIDKLMERTSKRPIVTGVISKTNAAIFATVIGVLSLIMFWVFTTPLATLLTLIAIVFYVLVYTMALKQRTSQNIVWGGVAGCMPVLIGWSAVTNSLSMTALAFFMVIFFWTPPHFWALAVRYKEDYSAASIPMLPVVAPMKSVINQMWLHSTLMAVISVLVITSAKLPVWILIFSVLLIIGWKIQLIKLTKEPTEVNAGKLFQASIIFLSIYSFLLVIGVLLK